MRGLIRGIDAPGGGGGAGGLSNINVSAGTTSNNLSNLVFSNLNGVSFGLDASTITGSIATSLTNIRVSAGTTSNLLSAITFADANGISFGINASTVTGSHNALTSQSNQAVSAANGSFTFQTLSFSNLNGVSFVTAAGNAIQASHNGITSQSNQQMTLFATGNTTQSSTGTSNASSLIFRGSGAASIGITNGSVLIDVAAGAAAITQSIGMSTETAGGATAGTAGYVTGDDILYHFAPGSNITMSQSVNGASGTLSIFAPTASPEITLSYWDNMGLNSNSNALGGAPPGNAVAFIFPLDAADRYFPGRITANTLMLNFSVSGSTATMSQTHSTRVSFGIYTRANGSQLTLVNSVSTVFGVSVATSNGSTNAQGQRWLTIDSSQWSAQPVFSSGVVYYGLLWIRSSNVSANTFSILGQFAYSTASRSGTIGVNSASATSRGFSPFLGVYSASFSTAMPNAIAQSEINKAGANQNLQPHVVFNAMTSIV